MSNFSNLRNRPFLVVNTLTRPTKGANTSKKGWGEDRGNWDLFESPYVVDRVSNRVMCEATVIIDVMSGTVVKNRFADSTSNDDVATHYMTKYKTQIAEAMDVWLSRMTQRIAADPMLNPSETVAALRAKAADLAGSASIDAPAGV